MEIKKRGQITRKRRPVILIATEGKNKTEQIYFDNFKRNKKFSVIYSKGNYTDPVNMVNSLQKDIKKMELQKKEGDCAFCIFDTDTKLSKQIQINDALKKVNTKNGIIEIITSNPCFEIWFKFHFSDSTKSYSNNLELMNDLKKLIPEYKKNIDVYPIISDKTDVAIRNAKKIENYHMNEGKYAYNINSNPSTLVYKVVEKLKKS